MNFLAHAYLSFGHPQILVGNMISDFVKGAQKNNFEKDVWQGIMLHRAIDDFTDTHPVTQRAKEVFRPYYRLYSGALMDILYDYFLANDPGIFDEASLKEFSQTVYTVLEAHSTHLPSRFVQLLTYMKLEDWLYNYRNMQGIERSLRGLVRRAAYLSESTTAYTLFINHIPFLQQCYQDFFPDVKQFAKQRLSELLT